MEDSWRRIWVQLKDHILKKNSHGKNELLEKMVELEIKEFSSMSIHPHIHETPVGDTGLPKEP